MCPSRLLVDGQRVGIATQAPYTVSWQGSVGPVTVVAEIADTHVKRKHLTRDASYHLRVRSQDEGWHFAYSPDVSFSTAK